MSFAPAQASGLVIYRRIAYWVADAAFFCTSLVNRDFIREAILGWIALLREALSKNETASLKEASSDEASAFLTRVFIRYLMAVFLSFAFLPVLSLFLADLCVGNAFLLAF